MPYRSMEVRRLEELVDAASSRPPFWGLTAVCGHFGNGNLSRFERFGAGTHRPTNTFFREKRGGRSRPVPS
jgi:hypothetical protein